MSAVRPPHEEAAVGIAELEGYLSWQAELGTARAEADALTADLPWLTTAQRAALAERYVHHRLRLTRRFLTAVAEHRRTLETDYANRYRQYRKRLLCATFCALAALASLATTALLMATHT